MRRNAVLFSAVFLVALVPRLLGVAVTPHPPSEAEAVAFQAGDRGEFSKRLERARTLSVLLSAVSVVATAYAALCLHGASGFLAAALIGTVCPLSIAAAREAGPQAAGELVAAALCVAVCARGEGRLARRVVAPALAAIAVAGWWAAPAMAGAAPEFVLEPWRRAAGPWLGTLLAASHHMGHALLLLAAAAFATGAARRVGWALLSAAGLCVLLGSGLPDRLAEMAPIVPPLVLSAASLASAVSGRTTRPAFDRHLPALGLLALILAPMAPVAASDALDGPRFPWTDALFRPSEGGLDEVERSGARIFSPLPAAPSVLLGREVTRLPEDPVAARDLLRGDEAVCILVPCDGGRPIGTSRAVLSALEGDGLASAEFRARRFDLYRPSILVFRSRPGP